MSDTNTDIKLTTRAQRAQKKLSRIPIKIEPQREVLKKPPWIRITLGDAQKISALKEKFRNKKLVTVCEEAACPNLSECFSHGTATFMIMGENCTRRCTFCDVGHGRPEPLDPAEPQNLATTIKQMGLKYVVITSVDRDDLRDGGAAHFVACIELIRAQNPGIKIEILTPDFRRREDKALEILARAVPDVFNHNIETVPDLYLQVRPGSSYAGSLTLLQRFKQNHPQIPTKSGIMLGLGETKDQVVKTFTTLRAHDVDMLTVGQYLQPTRFHHPVMRYWTPQEFTELGNIARDLGFSHVASGPLVRSSYHADRQAKGEDVS